MKKTKESKTSFKLISNKKNKIDKSWVNRHLNDHYVHLASSAGYRSRAAFKLLELEEPHKFLANAKTIVDLGSAPGSWSQVAKSKMAKDAFLLSVDLLPMVEIHGVYFIQGDFTENSILDEMLRVLNGRIVDLIISDMAPNISGIKSVDQARGSYLIELVLDFAKDHLKVGGNCIIKVFNGGEFQRLLTLAREIFEKVDVEKPDSSRSKSSETYLLCRNKV